MLRMGEYIIFLCQHGLTIFLVITAEDIEGTEDVEQNIISICSGFFWGILSPQRARRAQRLNETIYGLCVLCALCGLIPKNNALLIFLFALNLSSTP